MLAWKQLCGLLIARRKLAILDFKNACFNHFSNLIERNDVVLIGINGIWGERASDMANRQGCMLSFKLYLNAYLLIVQLLL